MAAETRPALRTIHGITFYHPPDGELLTARDGKVSIPLGDIPLPLLHEDHGDGVPSYDAVGRGLYHLLRIDPDAPYAESYARLLKEAYPHLLAELATHLVMLDKKDVDLPYLDRKINYLKIFALLERDNPRFPFEIGATFFDQAFSLAAPGNTTRYLFSAETYLRRAVQLDASDLQTRFLVGEVCFFIGKYDDAVSFWSGMDGDIPEDLSARITLHREEIAGGKLPPVPLVDFLQAIGVAMELYDIGNFEEAAAILLDVLDAVAGVNAFPSAETNYLLGLCYVKLDIPRYAEQYLRQALLLRPGYEEAQQELEKLGVC